MVDPEKVRSTPSPQRSAGMKETRPTRTRSAIVLLTDTPAFDAIWSADRLANDATGPRFPAWPAPTAIFGASAAETLDVLIGSWVAGRCHGPELGLLFRRGRRATL